MLNKLNFLFVFLITVVLILVFKNIFTNSIVTGGDLRFIYNSMYSNYSFFPYAWLPNEGIGLGAFAGSLAWVYLVTSLPVIFIGSFLKQSWNMVVIFGYIIPFLFISFFSMKALLRKLFEKNNFYILSFLLYTANTYILMVLGGGQVLIVLTYALFPLTLLVSIISTEKILSLLEQSGFFTNTKKTALKLISITGVVFSFQLLLDPRIAYVTFSVILIYLFLQLSFFIKQKIINKVILFLAVFIMPLIIAAFINMFWILPTIVLNQNPLESFGKAYTTLDAVKYFSFAKLENSISLLHPLWPENIFGKVSFMRPEFLLLPILAFAALFFIKKNGQAREKTYVMFFALLGIIGAFLAKGANEPFGEVYLWMFNHVPGFILFRDPTKWYMLVAISYSVLIPFTIMNIYSWLKSNNKFPISNFQFPINLKNKILNSQNIFLLFIVIYLLFLIRPALLGQLSGIFAYHNIPAEYKNLEQFIAKDKQFYRTLWFPQTQRFASYSRIHSIVSANNLFNTYDLPSLLRKLYEPETEKLLQDFSIRYIVVPFDSEGEIFLKDRKYDNKQYLETIRQLKNIKWLTEVDCSIAKLLNCSEEPFGKIKVFEIPSPKDHFWTNSKDLILNARYVSPVEYNVNVKNARKGDLIIFAESYDPKWVAYEDNLSFNSKQYNKLFNSFRLEKEGNYTIRVYYSPQVYVNIGMGISIISLLIVIFFLILGFRYKK